MQLAPEYNEVRSGSYEDFCIKQDERACRIMGPYYTDEYKEAIEAEAALKRRSAALLLDKIKLINLRKAAAMAFANGIKLGLGQFNCQIILHQVSHTSGIPVHDLIGPGRQADIARVRLEIYYRCRMEVDASWSRIGNVMGGRDHTTIMTGAHRHAERNGLPKPPSDTRRYSCGPRKKESATA